MSDELGERKAQLRRRVLAARAALSAAARDRGSAAVRERLRRLPELAGVQAVLGYAATTSEVDLDPLLGELIAAGVAVHLPWVEGQRLGVAEVERVEDLLTGWRGVREPAPTGRRAVRPERLDVVLAPGVAFDRAGRRLGYGGGHFDRLLARLRRGCVVVGVCFDEQLVDRVPSASHDRSVDVVVTPSETVRPAQGP